MQKHKKINYPLIFTVFSIITLICLGFWQIKRMYEKQEFLTNLKTNLAKPPTEIDISSNNMILATKIIINGQFISGHDLHLYGQRSGSSDKNGYYLLSPFKTDDNKIVIVARGWFSQLNKRKMFNVSNPGHQSITGVILMAEKQKLFVPHNDLKNNVWFTLDLQQIAKAIKMDIENYYLLSFDEEDLPANLEPISSKSLLSIRNDHLQYAITWFALAIAIMVIYIVYSRNPD